MKRADFQRFIDALEGKGPKKYKKINGQLGRGKPENCNMCAQGVLCDLMNDQRWVLDEKGNIQAYNFGPNNENNGGIPPEVLKCIGLMNPKSAAKYGGNWEDSIIDRIPGWNDGGVSFKTIAARLKQAVKNGDIALED